jgi:hypothetical protein
MQVSRKIWNEYIRALSRFDKRAGDAMRRWIEEHGTDDLKAMTEYAYRLATVYGEGAAALAAEMYDAVGAMEGVELPPAEVAPTATYQDTANAIYGVAKVSLSAGMFAGAVSRLVKMAGADTTLRNAIRDKAEFAWIPSGDTCAFCIDIAAEGWKQATANAMRGGHAEHIHGNCDCEYAIRHEKSTRYPGYNPQRYQDMVEDAPLDGEAPTAQNRINAMRREFYAENRERINAQKRDAYAKRQELDASSAEEKDV